MPDEPAAARLRAALETFRVRLASVEALPQLVLLAIVAGALTALVSLAFRGSIELIGGWLLPGGDSENFEGLPPLERFVLPFLGATGVGAVLHFVRPADRRVGVAHVMERLSRYQGHLRLRNGLTQFFGGVAVLSLGVSGGREGPAIHLGAATSSLLGQAFRLPNNSIRTLVGCGTAAAVACSFNTPIAGVILALEVVMLDYAVASFLPVIVAAVTSTLIMRAFYGDAPAFAVSNLSLGSAWEIPYVVVAGLLCGAVAVAFIRCVSFFAGFASAPIALRCVVAGVVTALAGVLAPDVMGIGYDTVGRALDGHIALTVLLAALVLKVLATSACAGLGLPVGLIGPSLVTGALLGGVLGIVAESVAPAYASPVGVYVMLGMCAVMAAMLQAPLAALMALLELTANPSILLPAMLIIVVASMTASQVFGQTSVFKMLLARLGLVYEANPLTLHLQRAGVASLMERQFARLDEVVDRAAAIAALERQPKWIVVESARGQLRSILNAADLRRFLQSEEAPRMEGDRIELMQVPGLREDVSTVDVQATVHEALEELDRTGAEALCVRRTTAPMIAPVVGVLTREEIERFVRFG